MRRIGVLSVGMIAVALAAPRAVAGQASAVAGTSAAALLAPTMTHATLFGPDWPSVPRLGVSYVPVAELPQVRNRRGIPWMIAGGAMFLAGAIIGDDGGTLLLLGGVGVGAYGAYVYFEG